MLAQSPYRGGVRGRNCLGRIILRARSAKLMPKRLHILPAGGERSSSDLGCKGGGGIVELARKAAASVRTEWAVRVAATRPVRNYRGMQQRKNSLKRWRSSGSSLLTRISIFNSAFKPSSSVPNKHASRVHGTPQTRNFMFTSSSYILVAGKPSEQPSSLFTSFPAGTLND
ncbi:uncharacterized protein [Miscanthus floridulus]|uniref:uncharacterized protein n=1 Tax=Miscanthus floridulus TaxID=154761 RepID=UPI0034585EA9